MNIQHQAAKLTDKARVLTEFAAKHHHHHPDGWVSMINTEEPPAVFYNQGRAVREAFGADGWELDINLKQAGKLVDGVRVICLLEHPLTHSPLFIRI